METEDDSNFITKAKWTEYYEGFNADYKNYLKLRQEEIDFNYRLKEGYDAKTLHPIPKDK
jgi:hypothetical protein